LRKITALAVAGVLAVAASMAFAAQTNTYTVTGKVTPVKVGTKKKPTPVQLYFGYTVAEVDGKRPALIDQYEIFFENGQTNAGLFPKCSAESIDAAQSDSHCPKGSLMGTGNVENKSGSSSDETSQALSCHLDLRLHNGGVVGGEQHFTLYLHGAQDPDPAKNCPLAVDKAIDAKFVKRSNGTALVFAVDDSLLNPAPGFDNAVVYVESTVNKVTTKVKGKTRGFFESKGKCGSDKKSEISVTFRQRDDGKKSTVKSTTKCTD
jgi:hypothetical protein